jgi:predicted GIY-YIG superfamily endonuclease
MYGPWNNISGNYAFAYHVHNGLWKILYVGQTQNFNDRFPHHERWPEAHQLGATHVFARGNLLGKSSRISEEKDLISFYRPEMNEQLIPNPFNIF